jgi:hypothetical protein
MSASHSYKNVGRSPSKLDYGIEQDPLDWRRLRGMVSRDRDSEIIKRANLYNFVWGCYVWKEGIYEPGVWRAIAKAEEEKKYSQVRENIALPPLE